MKIVEGDLIKLAQEGQFDVIIHGCNCFCTMGAGIAKGIKEAFPEAFAADANTDPGDETKLGSYTSVTVDGVTVINAYTQYNYRGRGRRANYDALRSVFKKIKKDFAGKRMGYPLIGAGLAGGDWEVIATIITEELEGEDHTLVKYVP